MEITSIETIGFEEDSPLVNTERDIRLTFVRLHTKEGICGLGETFPLHGMETEAIHGPIAELLLGKDAKKIEAFNDNMYNYFNYYGYAGAELRAMSAIDIALWDLKGKYLDAPIYELLGGRTREVIPMYNTCYETEFDFMNEPVELAESLLDLGINSMKIWPFDSYAEKTRGQRISRRDLLEAIEPIKVIRENFGDEINVAIEGHGLWALPPAKKIARAIEKYDPIWIEDLIRKGNLERYGQLQKVTEVPLCVSERLMGLYEFDMVIDSGAVDIVMPDLCWTGGFTGGKKIAGMAEAKHLPIAPHNSGGPVLHFANKHFSAVIPNLFLMESIRDRYNGWHRDLITNNSMLENGKLILPDEPGLGTKIKPEIIDHPTTNVRQTRV